MGFLDYGIKNDLSSSVISFAFAANILYLSTVIGGNTNNIFYDVTAGKGVIFKGWAYGNQFAWIPSFSSDNTFIAVINSEPLSEFFEETYPNMTSQVHKEWKPNYKLFESLGSVYLSGNDLILFHTVLIDH